MTIHRAITREFPVIDARNEVIHDADILWPECDTGTWFPDGTRVSPSAFADTDQVLQEEIPTGRWSHRKFGFWPANTVPGVGV